MSLSIDKDLGEQGENARAVLASWLDDYISGRCDRAEMQTQFLSVCRSNPDAPWDALALLDQYQRRGRIDVALARSLKTDIAQLVFGVANQTETKDDDVSSTAPTDSGEATIDTTGSRWRKLIADRDPESMNSEPAFVDPTQFRRDYEGPVTRPPPRTRADEHVSSRDSRPEPAADVRVHGFGEDRPSRPMKASAGPTSDVLRDRYELISILGRGSTGSVYKAVDRHRAHLDASSRCVAVKVLKLNYQDRPEELAQLEREFHQAQSLSHPNVVSVFDLDRDGSVYFIVMELLEGELLADILKRLDGQPMARLFALGIISSVGAALSHAHRRDIVHADLKPRNIMITTSGEVRVLDFGFARERSLDLHTASGLHEAPSTAPAYASVERVNGSEPHPSDDVYSLACIAYELLSGRHPFGGRSAALARVHGRHPQRVPGLTNKQQQALQRALMWSRGERRIDVAELLAGLGCGEAPNQLAPPEQLAIPHGSRTRWRRLVVLAVLAMLIAGGAYVVWQYRLLPMNLSGVLPVTPPFADRELQSEAPAASSADAEQGADASDATTPSPIVPPAVAPISPAPSTSSQTNRNGSRASQTPTTQSPAPSSRSSAQPVETSPLSTERVTPPPKESPQSNSDRTRSQQPQVNAPTAAAPATPAAAPTASASTKPVTIEFEKDTYVASEGDGSVRLVIRRSGSTRKEVSFTWILRKNSAEPGSDYAAIGPGTERIPAGAREVSITIPLVQDAVKESTELFLVELQVEGEGVVLGERSSAAVIIVDDD